jgi:hypothetical protein
MPLIPPELGSKVTARDYSWEDRCTRAWGSEFRAPDHGIYVFTGRKYDSTDKNRTGIYGVEVPDELLVSGTQYPDMRDVWIRQIGYGYEISEPWDPPGLNPLVVDEA